MGTSRIPATIDALVAAFTAAGLKTWDGPEVSGDYKPAVFVGYDGDPEGDFVAATPEQEWAGLGAKARDEEFDVHCCVIALSGDSSVKLARDTVDAMTDLVEDALRANPSLGMSPPFVAGYKPGELSYPPGSRGYQVRQQFDVHVKTRI